MDFSLLQVVIAAETDIVQVRSRTRRLAELVGFDLQDQTRITTAVSEIARNTYEYARGGRISFRLTGETRYKNFEIFVRDRGPGISPEHWSRVFERFYKVDRARPREAGGFGLGLAITKHLVHVLGGRIWTEAAREGGQVFYIALPKEALTGT